MTRNGGLRARLRIAACLLLVAGGCSGRSGPREDLPARNAKANDQTSTAETGRDAKAVKASLPTVELVIDYGDGAQKRFSGIPWKKSMTVLDVLKAAQEHPHGISFSDRGSGETAMVTKIDDLANQSGGADAKDWIFRINGRLGDESCGIADVRPGDTVLWKFERYE